MIRHPRYLEIPWNVHWHQRETGPHRHLWLFMAILILLTMILVGVGVTGGLV